MVSGEPESAAWWFPSNDHPSDPALMDVSIRVPARPAAMSVGRLGHRGQRRPRPTGTRGAGYGGRPMATYLTFAAIGELRAAAGRGGTASLRLRGQRPAVGRRTRERRSPRSRPPPRRSASSPPIRPVPVHRARRHRRRRRRLCPSTGWRRRPDRSTRRGSIRRPAGTPTSWWTHELAHMSLRGRRHRRASGTTSSTQRGVRVLGGLGLAGSGNGGPDRAERAGRASSPGPGDARDFWRVTMIDPGRRNMFTTVYLRGPMTLQALRNVMGDEAFTRLNVEWAQDPGTRSLEDWMAKAQSLTGDRPRTVLPGLNIRGRGPRPDGGQRPRVGARAVLPGWGRARPADARVAGARAGGLRARPRRTPRPPGPPSGWGRRRVS